MARSRSSLSSDFYDLSRELATARRNAARRDATRGDAARRDEIRARYVPELDVDVDLGLSCPPEVLDDWSLPSESQCRSLIPFGDKGTIVNINELGGIVQIAKFLNRGENGMFSVESNLISEPLLHDTRDRQFEEAIGNSHLAFGLQLDFGTEIEQQAVAFLHDRWPMLGSRFYDISVIMQFLVEQGIVYQQCLLSNRSAEEATIDFKLETETCIYELDYHDSDLPFNYLNRNFQIPGPQGLNRVLVKELGSGPEAVQNVTQLFFDGKPINPETTSITIPGHATREILVAYKLQIAHAEKAAAESLTIRYFDVSQFLRHQNNQRWVVSKDKRWNFVFRRHLEHLLSVAAVPLDPDNNNSPIVFVPGTVSASEPKVEYDMDILHFLLSASVMLADDCSVDQELKTKLQRRIQNICRRYLEHKSAFALTRRLYPKAMGNWFVGRTRIGLALSGAVQFVNLLRYVKTYPEEMGTVLDMVRVSLQIWIQDLNDSRDPRTSLWCRTTKRNVRKYRLADNLLIWKAFRSLQLIVEQANSSIDGADTRIDYINKTLVEAVWPAELQSVIRDSFIVATDNKRNAKAFATSRSNQQDRFLFYSTDAIYYECLQWGFFNDHTSRNAWNQTTEAQIKDQEKSWVKPERYLLAIIAGRYGHPIGTSTSANDLASRARQILTESVSSSGLFARRLEKITKRPLYFSHPNPKGSWILLEEANRQMSQVSREYMRLDPVNGDYAPDKSGSKAFSLRKRTGRKLAFDPQMVTNMQDEWLFPYPEFMDFQPAYAVAYEDDLDADSFMSQEDPEDLRAKQRSAYIRDKILLEVRNIMNDHYVSKTLIKGAQMYYQEGGRPNPRPSMSDVYIVNIARNESEGRRRKRRETKIYARLSCLRLETLLREKRTSAVARKRLIYVQERGRGKEFAEIACTIYLALPDQERKCISEFIERYKRFGRFFSDKTDFAQNAWETEIHLPFYKMHSWTAQDAESLHRTYGSGITIMVPGRRPKIISEVIISFRFVGDMFDKYWTSYVLVHLGRPSNVRQSSWFQFNGRAGEDEDFHQHYQRKVLELCIFQQMTKEATISTDDIINLIEARIGEGAINLIGGPTEDSLRDDLASSCPKLQQTLRLIKENLRANLALADRWIGRDSQAGTERPRWTEKDETRCREKITKESILITRNIDRMKSQLERVDNILKEIENFLLYHNSDKQLREAKQATQQAEDVRLFTYVTIIFLPLSFASSLFSMGGTPNSSTISTMAQTSVVALSITLILLLNFKLLNRHLQGLGNKLNKLAIEQMQKSVFSTWKPVAKDLEESRKRRIRRTEVPEKHESRWWYIWFCLAVITSELPARCITSAVFAVRELKESKTRDWPTSRYVFLGARMLGGLIFVPWLVTVFPMLWLYGFFQINEELIWVMARNTEAPSYNDSDSDSDGAATVTGLDATDTAMTTFDAKVAHRDMVRWLTHPAGIGLRGFRLRNYTDDAELVHDSLRRFNSEAGSTHEES
ncbi:MAG: hypothetical protein M1819_004028 [Sarea resinae]|nr:MAG: hypothetical protein M1819_004028 [Sarea resinae]